MRVNAIGLLYEALAAPTASLQVIAETKRVREVQRIIVDIGVYQSNTTVPRGMRRKLRRTASLLPEEYYMTWPLIGDTLRSIKPYTLLAHNIFWKISCHVTRH